jgi:hypothetical protein
VDSYEVLVDRVDPLSPVHLRYVLVPAEYVKELRHLEREQLTVELHFIVVLGSIRVRKQLGLNIHRLGYEILTGFGLDILV